jgi:hypothetical protein
LKMSRSLLMFFSAFCTCCNFSASASLLFFN